MDIIHRTKKRLISLLERFILRSEERAAIKKLQHEFSQQQEKVGKPLTVAVDGLLCMRFVFLYYLFLLLLLRYKSERPVQLVVICGDRKNCHAAANRMYSWFFPTVYVPLEGFLTDSELKQAAVDVQDILEKAADGNALFSLWYKGFNIGQDVYYAYLRDKLIGTINQTPSDLAIIIRRAVNYTNVAEKLIRIHKPEYLLITDNCYATFSPLFHTFLRHDIPVGLTVTHASGTGKVCGRLYTSIDEAENVTRRYPFSYTDETWQQLLIDYDDNSDEITGAYLRERFAGNDLIFDGSYHKFTTRISNDALRKELGVPSFCRKTVLLAAHLFWDNPGYKGLYRDYELWLKDTLDIIAENPFVCWIVKAHPSEIRIGTNRYARDVFHERFSSDIPPHIVFLDADTKLNTYSLIDFVDAVLTVRGTIGFEAACKGKLVVTAGTGPHSGLDIAKEFSSKEEYRTYLLGFHNVNTTLDELYLKNARMALYGYFTLKAPCSPMLKRGDRLAAYANLSSDELYNDAVLNRIVDKMISKKGGDFL